MKRLLIALLITIPALCSATEIECFQNGKKIFTKQVHDVVYGDGFFIVTENTTNHILVIFTECVIKLDAPKKKIKSQ